MPQELIDIVVNEITDATDIVCLALTCGYFFRLLAQQVQTILKADSAPWAGDRLMFIVDYHTDTIQDIVSREEMKDMKKTKKTTRWDRKRTKEIKKLMRKVAHKDPSYGGWHDVYLKTSTESSEGFGRMRGNLMYAVSDRMCFKSAARSLNDSVDAVRRRFAILVRDVKDEPYVLRNLTIQRYVPECTLKQCQEAYKLSDRVTCAVLWAFYFGRTFYNTRFDIVPIRDVQGDGWKDMSNFVNMKFRKAAWTLEQIEVDIGASDDDESIKMKKEIQLMELLGF